MEIRIELPIEIESKSTTPSRLENRVSDIVSPGTKTACGTGSLQPDKVLVIET